KVSSINPKMIKIHYWEVIEEGNRIKRCKRYRQKNTKEKKCIIKINTETENYELKVDCSKEDKKYRKKAEMSNTKKKIYIPRIRRNQKLIDQGVTNEKGRKILSDIMNEMDKRRDQKAEF
ncbi:20233_t:CDS:2, partial [Gigaspora margarita]